MHHNTILEKDHLMYLLESNKIIKKLSCVNIIINMSSNPFFNIFFANANTYRNHRINHGKIMMFLAVLQKI